MKPWEAYTGAKINWIDLAQADYNPRLQQSIATKTVDFDIIEMGAPFEGDTAGQGLLNEMPDWVKDQIEYDDLVGYLQLQLELGMVRPIELISMEIVIHFAIELIILAQVQLVVAIIHQKLGKKLTKSLRT